MTRTAAIHRAINYAPHAAYIHGAPAGDVCADEIDVFIVVVSVATRLMNYRAIQRVESRGIEMSPTSESIERVNLVYLWCSALRGDFR